ncbi:protein-L-isoaspartate O-methyltransferase family protein [Pinisolibacter sp.]|uniref:protein-L-isoaspartate O-methyltransferase family protein n=1 Tax=Pinisolibacter sp. TaxID=2172024 RepID=UPI002FDEA686
MSVFADQRKTMVDNQIRTVDVTDHAVIDAFSTVGREAFVPAEMVALAYIDRPVRVADGRFVMQPAPLAKVVQLAAPQPGEKVLIVGGNTGYSAAIVAELGASVVMVEENADLAAKAEAALAGRDVAVVRGPLSAGCAAKGPYDLVLFDGSVEVVPDAFLAQVAEGGRIVAVEGTGQTGRATVTVKSSGTVSSRFVFNVPAMPLPGFARVREFAL